MINGVVPFLAIIGDAVVGEVMAPEDLIGQIGRARLGGITSLLSDALQDDQDLELAFVQVLWF